MEDQQTPDKNETPSVKAKKRGVTEKIPLAMKIAAKVMTESGFSQQETSRELSITRSSVQRAISDPNLDRKMIEQAKDLLPAKMYLIAFKIADRIMSHPEILEKMNPYMQTMVMAIMIDKARLMSDQSTENIAVKGAVQDVQGALQRLQDLKQKLSSIPAQADDSPSDRTK